jgi:hypothetical protein
MREDSRFRQHSFIISLFLLYLFFLLYSLYYILLIIFFTVVMPWLVLQIFLVMRD